MVGLVADTWKCFCSSRNLWFLGIALLFGRSICFGQESGIAYWGSFGEGSNRVEGVFVELSESSIFLGFDDELEWAVYSSEIKWRGEDEFDSSGLASSLIREEIVLARGSGLLRLNEDTEVLLESRWEEVGLHFQAYSRSNVRYYKFQLEGNASVEMHLVIDDEGEGYGLMVEDTSFLHGGSIGLSEQGTQVFQTRRGDRLEFDLSSEHFVYGLADGEAGKLRMLNFGPGVLAGNAKSAALAEVWNAFEKKEGDFSDALHFILEGSGSLPVAIEASATLDSRELGIGFRFPAIEVELYQLDFRDEWIPLFSSGPLSRVKTSGLGEFDYQLSGSLPASLPRGTYLVQVIGLNKFSAQVEIRARFDRMNSIAAVNGSTMYNRTATSLSHRFGFELEGHGSRKAIVRAVGPGLEYFGLDEGTLDPFLVVSKNGLKRWANEDWRDGVQPASDVEPLMSGAGAFPLSANGLDAVLSLALGSGQYEASSDRRGDDFGIEIMEVYLAGELDQ